MTDLVKKMIFNFCNLVDSAHSLRPLE